MTERISLILKSKNLSASQFADEIGIQRSSMSHVLSERNKPSLEFIQKILKRFPEINSDWLLFGTGQMYATVDLFSTPPVFARETTSVEQPPEKIEIQQVKPETETLFPNESEILPDDAPQPDIQPKETGILTEKLNMEKPELPKIQPPSIQKEEPPKSIERIIIFYSDRTFTEYSPGKD
jgi:transcriptional regulator with XRE-family HTH domain